MWINLTTKKLRLSEVKIGVGGVPLKMKRLRKGVRDVARRMHWLSPTRTHKCARPEFPCS